MRYLFSFLASQLQGLLTALVALSLLLSYSAGAETAILKVHVADCSGQQLKGVEIGVVGGESRSTLRDGEADLHLSPLIRQGQSVELHILSPSRLVILSPWNHLTIVPPFDTSFTVDVVVARRGAVDMLRNERALSGLTERLTADSTAAAVAGQPSDGGFDQRLQLVAKAIGLSPEDIDTAIRTWGKTTASLQDRALAELYARQYDEAINDFKSAAELAKDKVEADQRELAKIYFLQAYTEYLAGSTLESESSYKLAVDLTPNDPILLNNYAVTLRLNGKYDMSEKLFRRVIAIQETLWGVDDVRIVPAKNNLAQTLVAEGQTGEAEMLFTSGLLLRRAKLLSHDVRLSYSEADLGAFDAAIGHCDAALPLLREAATFYDSPLTIYPGDDPTKSKKMPKQRHGQIQDTGSYKAPRRNPDPSPVEVHLPAETKGSVRRERTNEPAQRIGPLRMDSGQPSPSRILITEASCATDPVERRQLLSYALDSAKNRFSATHSETAYALIALGEFDRENNHKERGDALLNEALAIQQKELGPTHPDVLSLEKEIADGH